MTYALSADPAVLAELAAVLRSIANERKPSSNVLRFLARAYEARAQANEACAKFESARASGEQKQAGQTGKALKSFVLSRVRRKSRAKTA
ncbi:MAG: hypothetical protein ACK5JM_06795 [Rhodoblastus sp.]